MTPNRNSSLVGKNPFHFQELTASSLRQVCKIIYNTILCSLLWLVLCCGSIKLTAQVKPIATIPDSLYTDADAIVLKDSTFVTISKLDQYREYTSKSVLVLRASDNVEYFNHYQVPYDKQTKIEFLQLVVTRPDGTLLTKIKKGEFKDISAVDQGTMYSEHRMKLFEYVPTEYPFIINFEGEISSENTAFLPEFRPYDCPRHSLVRSTYLIQNKTNTNLRFKKYNFDALALVERHAGDQHYFQVSNVRSLSYEAYLHSDLPNLKFALDRFYLAGVEGSGASWQELGNWYRSKIFAGTQNLPVEAKADILQLVGNESDSRKKIQKIYQYVQNRTRYISIQIGIGGEKPIDAASVHKYGYGDCKALTNYTKALLAVAGIPSNYTIIYSSNRRQHIDKDFVCLSGNHVILNVPLPNDTVWLECTSQNMAYNLMTTSTEGRDALAIGEHATYIVRTPALNAKTNLLKYVSTITVLPNGDIQGKLSSSCKGSYYLNHLAEASVEETAFRKAVLADLSELQEVKIQNTRRLNDREKAAYERDLEFTATKYCKKIGSELLMRAIPCDLIQHRLQKGKDKFGKHTFSGKEQLHEVIFELPQGFVIKTLPAAVDKNTTFGKYTLSFQREKNTLKVSRLFHLNDLELDTTQYNSFVTYMDEIVNLENTKILLSPQN